MDGQRIGSRYVAERLVGQGACGQVWAGRDSDGNTWAIKLLRSELAQDPGLVNRFVAERALLESIRHPHVVQVCDLVVEGATLAVVMPLIEGADLRTVLRQRGPIEPSAVAAWGAQMAGALQAAHAAGVVHRDVKPENVLVVESTDVAMLSDFGIARIVDGATHSTMMLGTPQYMAPEIAEGLPPGPAADLYSLGIMLYELCCGTTPFAGKGSAMATLRAHLGEVPGRPPGIPDPLWQVISTLMAKDPARRGGSARQIEAALSALVRALEGLPAASRLSEPPPVERFVTEAPAVDDAVAQQTAQWARPMSSHPGWSGASVAVHGSENWAPAGYVAAYPVPDPRYPGGGAPRKGTSPVLLGLAAVALVGAGVAAAVFLSGEEAGEAEAAPPAPTPTVTVTGTATSAPVSPAQVEQPNIPVPMPTQAVVQPRQLSTAAGGVAGTARPVEVTRPAATPTAPAVDVATRRDYAENMLETYLSTAEGGALTWDEMNSYYSDRVQWYDVRAPLTRQAVYERLQIDPTKERTRFRTIGVESFEAGTTYGGNQADVMTLRRTFLRPSGAQGTILVTYVLAYDQGPEAPRIAKVSERRV